MASSADGPSLPHRNVSSIRASGSAGSNVGSAGTAPAASSRSDAAAIPRGSFQTPPRTAVPPFYVSPSTMRAEEELIVIEVGARQLRIGLAGEAVCRGEVAFGPEQQRRVGDMRAWLDGYQRDWRCVGEDGAGRTWDTAYELWQPDIRRIDAGLISDKLERALREAFTKYLTIDSRPRRMVVVVPPALPLPLVSTTLDTLFGRFQAPSVSLLSAPVVATVAAGLRGALVVDLGWSETVVTSVYEYREVSCTRTVRAGRMLIQQVHNLLAGVLSPEYREKETTPAAETSGETGIRKHFLSFEECEDVTARLVWCRQTESGPSKDNAGPAVQLLAQEEGLATVAETDETEDEADAAKPSASQLSSTTNSARITRVPLRSCTPPTTLSLTFDQLSAPCETTFFGGTGEGLDIPASWDDEELPVPLLIHRHLQHLPLEVRAACMSRIVFTGGCTNVLGLRARVFDEVARLVDEQGWEGVRGKSVDKYKAGKRLQQQARIKEMASPTSSSTSSTAEEDGADDGNDEDGGDAPSSRRRRRDAANEKPQADPIEETMRAARGRSDSAVEAAEGSAATAAIRGKLRAVETLGPWGGASLLAQLRVPALAAIDKEQWTLQGGAQGAVRPSELNTRTQQQRQSMGPSGLLRGGGAGGGSLGAGGGLGSGAASFTLGSWGVV